MPTEELGDLQLDPNTVYLVKGSTLQKILRAVKANRPLAGKGVSVAQSDQGTTINTICTSNE